MNYPLTIDPDLCFLYSSIVFQIFPIICLLSFFKYLFLLFLKPVPVKYERSSQFLVEFFLQNIGNRSFAVLSVPNVSWLPLTEHDLPLSQILFSPFD